MFEEWTAWFVVRDRERDLERRRLEREAEQARTQQRKPGTIPQPATRQPAPEHAGRKKAA